MMLTKQGIWARYKVYVIALLICVWGALFFTAMSRNPSSGETQRQLVMMKSDMDALISHGGKVLNVYENAKYGGAILLLTLHDEGWSDNLVQMYEETLLKRDWKRLPGLSRAFCKNNAEARIVTNSGMKDGHGVNSLAMNFDAATITKCNVFSPAGK